MSEKNHIIRIPRKNFYLVIFAAWFLSSLGTIGVLNISSTQQTNTQSNAATPKCATAGGTCKTLALCSQGGGTSAGALDCASGVNLGGIVCCKAKAAAKPKAPAPSKVKCATQGGLCKTLALCSQGGGKSLGALDCATGANLGGVVCCQQTAASKKSQCITSGGVCKTSALCSQGGGVSAGAMDCATGTNTGGIVCCKSSATSQSDSCKKAGGSCGNLNSCKGTVKKGLCPGGTDNVCCISTKKSSGTDTDVDDSKGRPQPKLKVPEAGQKSTECVSKGGSCYDSNTKKCSGSTRTFADHYMCPGNWNNVCCLKGGKVSGLTAADKKQTACERQGGQCGASSKYTCSAGFKPGLCSGDVGCCRGTLTCKDKNDKSCKAVDTTKPNPKPKTTDPKPDNKPPKDASDGAQPDNGAPDEQQPQPDNGQPNEATDGAQPNPQQQQPTMSLVAILEGINTGTPPSAGNQSISATLTFSPQLEGLSDQEKLAAKVSSVSATLTFDTAAGSFKGDIDVKDINPGNYQILVHIDRYTDKLLTSSSGSNVFMIGAGAKIVAAPVQMTAGDISGNTQGVKSKGDNTINVADWNLFIACFGKSPTGGCATSDLNLDGKIDEKDQEILVRNIGKSGVSFDKEELVCGQDPSCMQGERGLQMCQLICTQQKVHHDFREDLLKQYEE